MNVQHDPTLLIHYRCHAKNDTGLQKLDGFRRYLIDGGGDLVAAAITDNDFGFFVFDGYQLG